MNDELFPAEAVAMDSPKLAWCKKHSVVIYRHPGDAFGCPHSWFAGFQDWWPDLRGLNFFAEETAHNGDSRCVEAGTEEDALATLARYYKIPLWNEEQFTK
jgi:hypothetical protein